ncbi:hypothetical protein PTKIN_Ptkin01aG0316200 [Pterospermum kingtungense]
MATTEGKAETKQESKPEAKPEPKEVEEYQEPPLKYKAWVLKVSIHCEGCKRKVEKTLRNIQGVYEVSADLKQQKVAVKANLHVDVETLIKKLVKKGRHAELWPEKGEQKEKKKGKSKNKDKQGGQANSEEANNNNNNGGDKDKEKVKNEVSVHQETAKSCENGGSSKNGEGCSAGKAHEGGAPCKNGGQVKEPKPEVKQTVTVVAVEVKRIKRRGKKGMPTLMLILRRVSILVMLHLHALDHISLLMDLMVLFPCHLQPVTALHVSTTCMSIHHITMHHRFM